MLFCQKLVKLSKTYETINKTIKTTKLSPPQGKRRPHVTPPTANHKSHVLPRQCGPKPMNMCFIAQQLKPLTPLLTMGGPSTDTEDTELQCQHWQGPDCAANKPHTTHTHTHTHTDQQLTSAAKDIHHMTTIHMHHQHRRGNKQNKHGANTHRDQKWCYAYSTQQVALQAQVKILCVHVQARMPPMSAVCTKRCMQFNNTKQQHKSNAACKPASLH